MVMGSEGRGEQTVRTDQDNGLILSEPVPEADLKAFRAAFSDALDASAFRPVPATSWSAIRSGRRRWTIFATTSAAGSRCATRTGEHQSRDLL